VETTDSQSIRGIIADVVDYYHVHGIRVEIMDRGAPDFAVRSRVITALNRACGIDRLDDGTRHETEEITTGDAVEGAGGRAGRRGTGESGGTANTERLRRSRIYIPGNRPRMILKAPGFGADSVILDLEDSVPPEEKDAARIMVAQALRQVDFRGAERLVRINPLDVYGKEDLEAILATEAVGIVLPKCGEVDGIVLPKCEGVKDIEALEQLIASFGNTGKIAILPLIETAKGILNAHAIASCSPAVEALTFGGEDFTRDIGAVRSREGEEILLARSMLVMAAKAAGKQALDTVFADVKDLEGLHRDTGRMKRLGFDGKGAIHPDQIDVIHDVFNPNEAEIRHAVEVIHAAEMARTEGSGIAVLKGKMIDIPVIKRAEKILKIAKRIGIEVPEPSEGKG